MRLLAITFSLCACFAQGPQGGAQVIHQISHAENSPNISNVTGNVSVTYVVSSCTTELSYRSYGPDYSLPLWSSPISVTATGSIATLAGTSTTGNSPLIAFGGDYQTRFPMVVGAASSIPGLEALTKTSANSSLITFGTDGHVHFGSSLSDSSADSISGLIGTKPLVDLNLAMVNVDTKWPILGASVTAGALGTRPWEVHANDNNFAASIINAESLYPASFGQISKSLLDLSTRVTDWSKVGTTSVIGDRPQIVTLASAAEGLAFNPIPGISTGAMTWQETPGSTAVTYATDFTSTFSASSTSIFTLLPGISTTSVDSSKVSATSAVYTPQLVTLSSAIDVHTYTSIGGISTGTDVTKWWKNSGISNSVSGNDSASLSKAIVDLSADGKTVTGWAITYRTAEPR
jgi:hypothetical protein